MSEIDGRNQFISVQMSIDDLAFIAQVLDGAGQSYYLFAQDADMDGCPQLAQDEYRKHKRCQELAKAIALAGKMAQG